MKAYKIFYLIFFILSWVYAQDEFLVNTHLDSTQREPAIARDPAGNYVVVWTSEAQVDSHSQGDIFLQFFNSQDQKISSEILVNTATVGDQEKPAVAMNSSGDALVVWASQTNFTDSYDIYGQIYRNNQPFGSNFLINSTLPYAQTRPAVTWKNDGGFIVVWDSWMQDGSDRGVFCRLFDGNGNSTSGEIQVNTTTIYSQARPAIAMTSGGEFVVIWESWKQDIITPSGYGIFGQRFDSNGTKMGGEFQINTYTNDYQWLGDIESFDDGSFVVVWCSWEQDGDDGGIYLQRFDAQANKIGGEVRVNRSTLYYQWLPKLVRITSENFAVIWSSWKQDGDREGIYARIYNIYGRELTFETQLNMTTASFQWEPVAIGGSNEKEIVAVWSSWGQYGHDYEVIGRRFNFASAIGYMNPTTLTHLSGRTTSEFIVHVFDSSAVTGDTYEITFTTPDTLPDSMKIVNINTAQTVVHQFPFSGGEGLFYLTPTFEGVAVEVRPIFTLDVDTSRSFFSNHTGSNFSFLISTTNDNFRRIAPIDVALIWGNTDTLPNGQWANPLDTALSIAGTFTVSVPFRAWNLSDNEPLDLWVIESGAYYNQKWDPFETIRILTPPPYKTKLGDTHAVIQPQLPVGNRILPGIGDSILVFAKKPLTEQDTLRFTTDPAYIISGLETRTKNMVFKFELENNYPNPFNPTTTIAFSLANSGKIKLMVYNLLGQKVATLWDGYCQQGRHHLLFDASGLASGIYFYSLLQDNYSITRKMIILK